MHCYTLAAVNHDGKIHDRACSAYSPTVGNKFGNGRFGSHFLSIKVVPFLLWVVASSFMSPASVRTFNSSVLWLLAPETTVPFSCFAALGFPIHSS
jgi:hypothetical protein